MYWNSTHADKHDEPLSFINTCNGSQGACLLSPIYLYSKVNLSKMSLLYFLSVSISISILSNKCWNRQVKVWHLCYSYHMHSMSWPNYLILLGPYLSHNLSYYISTESLNKLIVTADILESFLIQLLALRIPKYY